MKLILVRYFPKYELKVQVSPALTLLKVCYTEVARSDLLFLCVCGCVSVSNVMLMTLLR